MSVSVRFINLLNNISLTDNQKTAGSNARESVVQVLNQKYWSASSGITNSKYIGSWGKLTRVRPPRDVDVLFTLPDTVYHRFQLRTGNKQSQLLQEVKNHLLTNFPSTSIRGDGPAVVVALSAYKVELIPAFTLTSDQYWIPMTDGGGYYKTADYDAETTKMASHSAKTAGNTRNLVRMAKCWQAYCDVPIKSFWLEIVAMEFLDQWEYASNSKSYYDWMVREYFRFLCGKASTTIYAPGTYESMPLGNAWESKAKTARDRAIKACEFEAANNVGAAGDEWQKIFGSDIPRIV